MCQLCIGRAPQVQKIALLQAWHLFLQARHLLFSSSLHVSLSPYVIILLPFPERVHCAWRCCVLCGEDICLTVRFSAGSGREPVITEGTDRSMYRAHKDDSKYSPRWASSSPVKGGRCVCIPLFIRMGRKMSGREGGSERGGLGGE